jgi:predicted transcriptional regulator
MKPIRIPTLSLEQLDALEKLYRTTHEARLRTRAQMVLLAAEQRLTAAEIAEIVRTSEETVRRWLKRYLVEGVEGLRDVPHPGAPRKVTEEYRKLLVEALSAVVLAAWGCRSRCGRCVVWLTTWPSRPASGWSMRPCECT